MLRIAPGDGRVKWPVVENSIDGPADGLPARAATAGQLAGEVEGVNLPLLGNIQDCLPPAGAVDKPAELHLPARRELLLNLQETAAMLTNNKRVFACLRVPVNTFSAVEVKASPAGVVYLHGLRRCGLLWSCPMCGSKIAQHRANELGQALTRWEESGRALAMVTYTLRHDATMPLVAVLQALQAAQGHYHSGRVYSLFEARYGVLGRVTSLEVTVGDSGWHVHVHELLLLAGSVSYYALERDALRRWQASLRRVGFSCNRHGVDVVPGDVARAEYLARYVAKFETPGELQAAGSGEWGLAQELALAASKVGRKGGRTPLQLLIDAHGGDLVAGELYREYVAGFFGKKHLRYSRGTPELLGLVERSDAEVVNAGGAGQVLRLISSPAWLGGGMADRRIEVLKSVIGGSR